MTEQYQELANAIIEQAVDDYRKLAKCYHHTVKMRKHVRKKATREELLYKQRAIRRKLTDIEKFFKSMWFTELTTIDGHMILKRLQEECRL